MFNDAFEALLAGWHRHMDLVASTDDILKLAESRRQLDALVRRAHRARSARKPARAGDDHLAAYCPFLATTVYIPTAQVRRTPHDTVEFECACERPVGHRVPGSLHRAPIRETPASPLRRLRLVTG